MIFLGVCVEEKITKYFQIDFYRLLKKKLVIAGLIHFHIMIILILAQFLLAKIQNEVVIYEPHRKESGFLPMQKQRRRSALQ